VPVTKPGVPPKKSTMSAPLPSHAPTLMPRTSKPSRLWRIVEVIEPPAAVPTMFGLSSQLASPEL
jgi:hypothetical protein